MGMGASDWATLKINHLAYEPKTKLSIATNLDDRLSWSRFSAFMLMNRAFIQANTRQLNA